MKKILILTAERTGTGHKSASNAIEKTLDKSKYEVMQIDSFTLMGRIGKWLENIYIPITTKFPLGYYICFLFTQAFPDIMHSLIYLKINRKFQKLIKENNPDLIISVHSMFTKSISHFLKKHNFEIPFYIDVIDLVNPPNVWFDKNADIVFVPTDEVKESYIKKGMNQDKIHVSGFPIRNDIIERNTPKQVEDILNILLVNPSVKLSKNIKYVKEVSKIKNSSINVICGRDKKMYKSLIKKQEQGYFSKNVKIYSFVQNMNEFLDNAHIILTKAGPNMILEAVKSGTMVVITGHILGQENYNYEFITKNEYGIKCENPNNIYQSLKEIIFSEKFDKYLNNVFNANIQNGAEFIKNVIEKIVI